MLGARKSALVVANTVLEKRVEEIKKVDIDIFDSGETKVESGEFTYSELTPGTPIQLNFIDKNTGYIRFNVKANGKSKIIISCVLDGETEFHPALIKNETESHYEFAFRLNQATATHFIALKIGNCRTTVDGVALKSASGEHIIFSQENFLFKFHILLRAKEQMSIVDVPQNSYRDALLNVTKLWLLSGKYDRVRQPHWAGFFDDRLRRYPMNEEGARAVEKDLLQAIHGKIHEVLISDCVAKPNLVERSWDVALTSTDTTTQTSTVNLSQQQKSVTINVDDENISKSTILEVG